MIAYLDPGSGDSGAQIATFVIAFVVVLAVLLLVVWLARRANSRPCPRCGSRVRTRRCVASPATSTSRPSDASRRASASWRLPLRAAPSPAPRSAPCTRPASAGCSCAASAGGGAGSELRAARDRAHVREHRDRRGDGRADHPGPRLSTPRRSCGTARSGSRCAPARPSAPAGHSGVVPGDRSRFPIASR